MVKKCGDGRLTRSQCHRAERSQYHPINHEFQVNMEIGKIDKVTGQKDGIELTVLR